MKHTIRNRVRELARSEGLSLLDISRETAIPYTSICRLARGACDIPLDHAIAIADVLEQSTDIVFSVSFPVTPASGSSRHAPGQNTRRNDA